MKKKPAIRGKSGPATPTEQLKKLGFKVRDKFYSSRLPLGWDSSPFTVSFDEDRVMTAVADAGLDLEDMSPSPIGCPKDEPTVASLFFDDSKKKKPVYLYYEALYEVAPSLEVFLASMSASPKKVGRAPKEKFAAGKKDFPAPPSPASGSSYNARLQAEQPEEYAIMLARTQAKHASGLSWYLMKIPTSFHGKGGVDLAKITITGKSVGYEEIRPDKSTWPAQAEFFISDKGTRNKRVLLADWMKGPGGMVLVSEFLRRRLEPILGADMEYLPVKLRLEKAKDFLAPDYFVLYPVHVAGSLEGDVKELAFLPTQFPKSAQTVVLGRGFSRPIFLVSSGVAEALKGLQIPGLELRDPRSYNRFSD